MSETEQLRKELNELRERLARLESQSLPLHRFGGAPNPTQTPWPTTPWQPTQPLYTLTCGGGAS